MIPLFFKDKKILGDYVFIILGEVPSIVIALFVIENPNFGRKYSIFYCFFSLSFIYPLFYITSAEKYSFLFSITTFILKITFSLLSPITSESYHTLNRTFGYGVAASFGRLGATIMPFFVFPLYEKWPEYFFCVFAIFSIFSSFICWIAPFSIVGKNMDERY